MMNATELEIKFVSTGGAFDTAYGNSACIVRHGDMRFLIDCGHAVFPRLVQLGIVDRIDAVLITHLHDDHVGSLSTLILYYNIVLRKGRLRIYVPNAVLQDLLTGLLTYSLGQVGEWVDFRPMAEIPGLGFIDTFGRHMAGMQTFAYYFYNQDKSIVYSGDNGDADFLVQQVQALQLPNPCIYHEVFFLFRFPSHAYYHDLMRLAAIYPIYGYHCNPTTAPADNTLPLVANIPELNY
jgi:ribonuclease BN (tRNA processing enzyme)